MFSGHPPSGVSCPPAVLRPSPQNRSPDNEKSSQTIRLLFSIQISISGPEGKTIILSEIEKPTKEGYIFDGWEGLSSVKIQAGTDTLFATWTPISES